MVPGTRPGTHDMFVAQRLFRVEGRLVGEREGEGGGGKRERERERERERAHTLGHPVEGRRCLGGQESCWFHNAMNIECS